MGAALFAFICASALAGCGGGLAEATGEPEVKRPQPLRAAQRTARMNAFGYPVYEPAGRALIEAAESVDDLTGTSEAELENFFGLAAGVVRDGEIRILRYQSTQCSLAFFLYPDAGGRRAVAFGKYERTGPLRANARSCLLSLARPQRP
jgi:hypothetical protein